MLTLNEQEEKAIDKIISALADYIQLEAVQHLLFLQNTHAYLVTPFAFPLVKP